MILAMPTAALGTYPGAGTCRPPGAGRASPAGVQRTFREDFDTNIGSEILTKSPLGGSRKAKEWAFHWHLHGFATLFLRSKRRILSKLQLNEVDKMLEKAKAMTQEGPYTPIEDPTVPGTK